MFLCSNERCSASGGADCCSTDSAKFQFINDLGLAAAGALHYVLQVTPA